MNFGKYNNVSVSECLSHLSKDTKINKTHNTQKEYVIIHTWCYIIYNNTLKYAITTILRILKHFQNNHIKFIYQELMLSKVT